MMRDNVMIYAFCTIAVLVVVYPICDFLRTQWGFRRDRLFGFLAGGAIIPYYVQFRPGSSIMQLPAGERSLLPSDRYMDAFEIDFYRWYGRRYYIGPIALLAVITAASALWGVETLKDWSLHSIDFTTNRAVTGSALAGGFVWVISDEIGRLRRRDFSVSDVYYYVFRILLCIPFGVVLGRFAFTAAAPLAFLLGTFPTTTLFTIGRRIASHQLRLGDDQASGSLELERLPAITRYTAERFNDEGVPSIAALARADPVDLTIKTNFDFTYVIDCISQALLWIYLEHPADGIFPPPLRGAVETGILIGGLENPKYADSVRHTIADAATKLKVSEQTLTITLQQIASNSFTKVLVKLSPKN